MYLVYLNLELRGEIEKLRSQTSSGVTPNDGLIGASLAEIAALKDKLSAKEWEMAEMTRYVRPPQLLHTIFIVGR